jgi:hypothetical protein
VTYTYRDPVDTINYTYRVDVVPGQPRWIEDAREAGGRRLNPAAFQVPAGAFGSRDQVNHGSEPRNSMRGFPTWQADVAVHKQIRLTARTSAQWRVEVHNVLNHPNFAQPDTSIGTVIGATGQLIPAAQFGRVTQTRGGFGGGAGIAATTGGARSVRLALRFTF